jgi:6-pyruvoyltetrahydropterin/6-carboxytetrahydropterin synthase
MLITKYVEFDMGHRVPFHKSKCRNPHGHRYRIEVALSGNVVDLNGVSESGMVMDFKDVKAILMKEAHDRLDHGFMYWEKDEEMTSFYKEHPEFLGISVSFTPTAENISMWLYNILKDKYHHKYDNNLKLEYVKLWETPTSVAVAP